MLTSNCFLFLPVACSRHLNSQLVSYICKTKKLERALKIKDVLCTSLADKLDVMKEEKKLRAMATDMSNNRINGNDCRVASGEFHGYGGTNESTCTREQVRNLQNEGSSDKAAVNGGVICSNEEEVPKAKFDSVEKELSQVKEELSKVLTEKSQVSREKYTLFKVHVSLHVNLKII